MKSNQICKKNRAFSLTELLLALGIMIVLLSIGMYAMSSYKNSKTVEVTANEIAFKLEEAKANSISGKNGNTFGIHFATSSYTYFEGSSYNASDTKNKKPSFPTDLSISNGLTASSSDIIFAKMTGTPNISGTITITKTSDTSKTKTITIGALGDISVVQ